MRIWLVWAALVVVAVAVFSVVPVWLTGSACAGLWLLRRRGPVRVTVVVDGLPAGCLDPWLARRGAVWLSDSRTAREVLAALPWGCHVLLSDPELGDVRSLHVETQFALQPRCAGQRIILPVVQRALEVMACEDEVAVHLDFPARARRFSAETMLGLVLHQLDEVVDTLTERQKPWCLSVQSVGRQGTTAALTGAAASRGKKLSTPDSSQ
jgi:hypothetical protein